MSSPSKDSHNISPSSIRDPNLEFKKDRLNKCKNIMKYMIHMNHTLYSYINGQLPEQSRFEYMKTRFERPVSCLLQECLDVELASWMHHWMRRNPHYFQFFFCISQKNSTKGKETSGSWLTVFSETLKNANILLHFATTLHKKGTCFQWNLKKLFFIV